jgi:hypothetical protein
MFASLVTRETFEKERASKVNTLDISSHVKDPKLLCRITMAPQQARLHFMTNNSTKYEHIPSPFQRSCSATEGDPYYVPPS